MYAQTRRFCVDRLMWTVANMPPRWAIRRRGRYYGACIAFMAMIELLDVLAEKETA